MGRRSGSTATEARPAHCTFRLMLPEPLRELVDRLARHAHGLWAQQRWSAGWRYGEHRDDEKKQQPCLVPYDELPESERSCDVAIAEGLLNSLLALGCTIEVPAALPDSSRSAASPPTAAEAAASGAEYRGPGDSHRDTAAAAVLEQRLQWCREIIEPQYLVCDRAALRHQTFHRYLTLIAGVGGTLAVLMAIFQLSKLGPGTWPAELEFAAAAIALLAVCAGLLAKSQRRWLLQRHKAERLQMLKFQFLITPALWTADRQRAGALLDPLRNQVRQVLRATRHDMELWLIDRPCDSDSGHQPTPTPLPGALVNYYVRERLEPQLAYATRRARRNASLERWTFLIGPSFFLLSVLAAFGHFMFEAVHKRTTARRPSA